MSDIRLSIQVDSTGAVRAVKTFSDEVEKVPASTKKASAGIDDLTKYVEKFASGIGIGTGVGIAVKGFDLMASGARALVGVLTGATSALLTYSDQMVTLGQRTGLSTTALQTLSVIAKTSGTDIEGLSKGVTKMEVNLAKGDKAFAKLGLSIADLKRMAPEEAFAKVGSAINGLGDPISKAAAAVAIFGKSGSELLPAFAADIDGISARFKNLNIDPQTLASVEALGDQMDEASIAGERLLMKFVGMVALSPTLKGLMDDLLGAFDKMGKFLDDNAKAFQKWGNIGIVAITELAAVMTGLLKIMSGMAKWTVPGMGALLNVAGVDAAIDKLHELTSTMAAAAQARIAAAGFLSGGSGGGPAGGGGPRFGGGGGGSKAAPWAPMFPGGWQKTYAGGMDWDEVMKDLAKVKPMGKGLRSAGPIDLGFVAEYEAQKKASMSASQALQNLANVAALSSSKLGKGLASIFGGAAGVSAGVSSFGGGLLSKIGAVGTIASAGIGIISGIVGLFKGKPKAPAPEPPKNASAESWASYVTGQQNSGAAGVLAGVSGIKAGTAAEMAAQGSIASQSFWAMFKSQGLIKAADAFRAVRDKMVETFKAAGADDAAIAAMIGPMSGIVDLSGTDAFRGAADGANGFAQALASIANEQLPMSISQFQAFEQQAVSGYEQMKQAAIEQGMSSEDAIRTAIQGSGQLLTTLQDASKKYGIGLGASQALFDTAGSAGIAFAGSSQDRLIASLDALTATLGGAPLRFVQSFQQGLSTSGAGVGFARSGGTVDQAGAIGDRIADRLGSAFDTIAGAISNMKPPTIIVNADLDGQDILSGLATAIERGGIGGQEFQTAIGGRG